MDRHDGRHFEHYQNLFAGRTRIERGANVAARSVRVKVRAGDVERHADQFPGLAEENPRDGPTLGAKRKLGISLPST